jgi:O-antigen/teichoic acid export membrane protein
MDAAIIKEVAQVAGIGGIALGTFLILFREIIRKNIFPRLSASDAYRLLRLIAGAVWSVAVIGILAWVYVGLGSAQKSSISTNAPKSPIIQTGPGGTTNVDIR